MKGSISIRMKEVIKTRIIISMSNKKGLMKKINNNKKNSFNSLHKDKINIKGRLKKCHLTYSKVNNYKRYNRLIK